ncbi:hypothetical protein AB0L05_17480 [Nonomuraea pusilla]|uniref:hypothetical protein n=1 Tax=Nonomuraea pusilla TaxID=46177 RepID=UPI003333C126
MTGLILCPWQREETMPPEHMSHEQQPPDPDRTVQRRLPPPAPPPTGNPLEQSTRRLPYTPDMLPDVPHYLAKPPRSAWWWTVLVGGLVLLIGAVAVGVVLWVRGNV